jgi:hypothetical protein
LVASVLDKDDGDHQDLAGDGDDAGSRGFHDTHFNFLLSREPFCSRNPCGGRPAQSQLQR